MTVDFYEPGLNAMIAARAAERDHIADLIVRLLGRFPKRLAEIRRTLLDEYGEIKTRRMQRIMVLLVEQRRAIRVADEGYRAPRRSDRA